VSFLKDRVMIKKVPARITWTEVQKQRLRELNANPEVEKRSFRDVYERNRSFHKVEQVLVKQGKRQLQKLRNFFRRPVLCEVETYMMNALTREGFVQVVTPIIMTKSFLEKMLIREEHPLFKQVFWVSKSKCLRPMLAPNLYYLLRELVRLWEKPVRIFEIGPCFRKDSKGKHHLNEFTMLNLVELGPPKKERDQRFQELVALIMDVAGIKEYRLVPNQCEVYGKTIDIVAGIEVGSGVIGPHFLDKNWGVIDPWIGVGFGLERIIMVREGYGNIQRVGRSLVYLNGVRLNI